jgi:hypothetical protein
MLMPKTIVGLMVVVLWSAARILLRTTVPSAPSPGDATVPK